MDNKDFHSDDSLQNKPLGKLVRVNDSKAISNETSAYRGKYEAEPSQYRGKYEAEPSEYRGR